jgi:hypothetical protein
MEDQSDRELGILIDELQSINKSGEKPMEHSASKTTHYVVIYFATHINLYKLPTAFSTTATCQGLTSSSPSTTPLMRAIVPRPL